MGLTQLSVLGVNHRSAPLALRERFTIPSRELADALQVLRNDPTICEGVILSTCNRIEWYVASDDPSASRQTLIDLLSHHSRLEPSAFAPHLYHYVGPAVAAHLFRVTSGLDSAILGESEIAAQVKEAYQIACAHRTLGPHLHRLFQKALHAAKEVRTRTVVGQGEASIGSVVAKLARQLFADRLSQCDVLLWGAGKAAEATARHLIKSGIGQLWIVNRTPLKAQDLAAICQSGWLSWEQALKHLGHVDIAIVCTQAPHYVIDEGDLDAVADQRGSRPLCLIDLAVPRNVDPSLKRRAGIALYNIDDLQAIAQSGLATRRDALAQCASLINDQVDRFLRRHTPRHNTETMTCQPLAASS